MRVAPIERIVAFGLRGIVLRQIESVEVRLAALAVIIVIAQRGINGRASGQRLIGLKEKGIVTGGLPIGIDHIAGMQHQIRIERHHPIGHGVLIAVDPVPLSPITAKLKGLIGRGCRAK